MPHPRRRRLRTPRLIAARATSLYVALGGLWLVASDRLVQDLAALPPWLSGLNTLKGGLFLLVTGALLFLGLERHVRNARERDPLTGLLDLKTLRQRLDLPRRLQADGDARQGIACLCIGAEGVHHVNHVYGRGAGDELLMGMAAYLERVLREGPEAQALPEPLICRAGGDRFFVVLRAGLAEAQRTAQRLLARMEELRFRARSGSTPVEFNIGVAACGPGDDPTRPIAQAEIAVFAARERKAQGGVFLFDQAAHEADARDISELDRVRAALEEKALAVHLQPIMDLRAGAVRHYEALVRFPAPGGGLQAPGTAIRVAERFGMIHHVDRFVLETVLAHLRELEAAGVEISMAVNLSGVSIGNPAFCRAVVGLLERSRPRPGALLLEVTETAAIFDLYQAKDFMLRLRELGCRFALDDFGAGFTSFNHLRTLPVDMVKIDGSFVRQVHRSRRDRALVQGIADVARLHEKQTVAEYVEHAEVLEVLRELGIDFAQGFHIGVPAPFSIAALAARHGREPLTTGS